MPRARWAERTPGWPRGSGDLAAVGDDNGLDGDVPCRRGVCLHRLDDVHAIGDLAEDAVPAVEVRGGDCRDEELRPVGVGAGVGHAEDAGAGVLVLVLEVLVGELLPVDGLAAPAVTPGDVPALSHEALNDPVELGSLEVQGHTGLALALLACAKGAEVLRGLGNEVRIQLHGHATLVGPADGNVEEDNGVGRATAEAEGGSLGLGGGERLQVEALGRGGVGAAQ
mmetsp:Transcript_18125/g.45665  ORF Transcript_18125/g.45665 Transcript_18125/m.45665 type:complete len:225 (-) Transcript_18125:109-783(-)